MIDAVRYDRTALRNGVVHIGLGAFSRAHMLTYLASTALNHAFELGFARVVLQASEIGYRVYERLGFTTYGHYERFVVPCAAVPS